MLFIHTLDRFLFVGYPSFGVGVPFCLFLCLSLSLFRRRRLSLEKILFGFFPISSRGRVLQFCSAVLLVSSSYSLLQQLQIKTNEISIASLCCLYSFTHIDRFAYLAFARELQLRTSAHFLVLWGVHTDEPSTRLNEVLLRGFVVVGFLICCFFFISVYIFVVIF